MGVSGHKKLALAFAIGAAVSAAAELLQEELSKLEPDLRRDFVVTSGGSRAQLWMREDNAWCRCETTTMRPMFAVGDRSRKVTWSSRE